MTPARRRPRVVVRAADPQIRSLIIRRLSLAGDFDVESDGAAGNDGTALVEAEEMEGRPGAPLTPREAEVLALMADGMANKEIAFRLGISASTAKFHVESILRKLSAANRAEAVREGIRLGMIGI
jgi:DNA-binding CsgD family transcriptional regulator